MLQYVFKLIQFSGFVKSKTILNYYAYLAKKQKNNLIVEYDLEI